MKWRETRGVDLSVNCILKSTQLTQSHAKIREGRGLHNVLALSGSKYNVYNSSTITTHAVKNRRVESIHKVVYHVDRLMKRIQDAPEARQAPDDCGDPDDKDQVGSEVYQ